MHGYRIRLKQNTLKEDEYIPFCQWDPQRSAQSLCKSHVKRMRTTVSLFEKTIPTVQSMYSSLHCLGGLISEQLVAKQDLLIYYMPSQTQQQFFKTHPWRLQIQRGNDQLSRARKEVRQAVVRGAEIVACTLSSAGGDLLTLSKGTAGFQALIIDEVGHLDQNHTADMFMSRIPCWLPDSVDLSICWACRQMSSCLTCSTIFCNRQVKKFDRYTSPCKWCYQVRSIENIRLSD